MVYTFRRFAVFQMAAHEEVVPVEQLYEYCKIARKILIGDAGVGRVIARPFIGESGQLYTRTAERHDFSLQPPKVTMLDQLKEAGIDVIGVGKINDIFCRKGYHGICTAQKAMQKGLTRRWSIWTGVLRVCALSIWWILICFTGIGMMWMDMQKHLPISMRGCRRF